MARLTLTRLDLKRQRERLARFERFLPALRLRQQQLQLALLQTDGGLREARARLDSARAAFEAYRGVLGDLAGLDVAGAARPAEVRTITSNVAGVAVPVLEEVAFRDVAYSLFGTPPWLDRALQDLRAVNTHQAAVDVLEEARRRLHLELIRVLQRVNLFEKVKIPEARHAVHRIRVHLGDEMAAAVGRAKIAKGRISGLKDASAEAMP
ncbi:MAG TPA: V-type ATP synthase subunit D [Longimicrobiales bacterium]|nr:V-type ATP synthase subunit D [Longimicrobiales bacterium]